MKRLTNEPRQNQIIGYARVSTKSQDTEIQLGELEKLGCVVAFEEKASGKSSNNREQLTALIKYTIKGDTVIITKLDRLARNTIDALKLIDELTDKGVSIKIMDIGGGMDLTTTTGRLMVTVLSAVAEMERKRIMERTKAGIDAAAEQGRYAGRPASKHTAEIIELKGKGLKQVEIIKKLGVSRSVVSRIFKEDKAAA